MKVRTKRNGFEEKPAWLIGAFAIHHQNCVDNDYYITHVPTGCMLAWGIRLLADNVTLVRALLQSGINWEKVTMPFEGKEAEKTIQIIHENNGQPALLE